MRSHFRAVNRISGWALWVRLLACVPILPCLVAARRANAVNATVLTSGGLNASQASYTTASITPSANKLILLSVSRHFGSGNTVSVAGNGLTWVQVDAQTYVSSNFEVALLRAMGGSPSSGTAVITYSGAGAPNRAAWSVIQIGNVDTGGTNGSAAIVQTTGVSNQADGQLTLTLGAFSSSNNGTFGALGIGNAGSSTPGSGFTELTDVSSGGDPVVNATEFKPGNDTSVDWTFGNNANAGIALELKYAGGSAVRLRSFAASRADEGAVLTWSTGYESGNLGFHIWRTETVGAGRWKRVTPSLVAGTALLAGPGAEMAAERSYAWLDREAGSGTVAYLLEDVDINGRSTWHGPVTAMAATPVGTASGGGGLWGLWPRPASWWPSARRQPLWAGSNGNSISIENQRGHIQPVRYSRSLASLGEEPALLAQDRTKVLGRQIVPMRLAGDDLAAQWAVVARPAIRIAVAEEGWYRIGADQLLAAGLGANVNPRALQLWADGREVPMLVRGESDGRFDQADSIEFYGLPLDTPWTGERTYWLVNSRGGGGATHQANRSA